MTTSERRKIVCSVTFHVIAITCVVWSLYVLIDRTAEEIKQGNDNGKCLSSSILIMRWMDLKCGYVTSHILFSRNTSLIHGYIRYFNAEVMNTSVLKACAMPLQRDLN